MSYSKPLPPFTFDLLCYLNREQLERFSIVCRPLKNVIERYFCTKPYRTFDQLEIRRGSYALFHNRVQWHLNRDDYSVQQFLAGQQCSIDSINDYTYYSFDKMCQYLGLAVRITETIIDIPFTYYFEHIELMESIAYLWRDGIISICNVKYSQTDDEDFPQILNSPSILQCRHLNMDNTVFSFKDYPILYTVKVLDIDYGNKMIDPDYWLQFLEQPGVKPVVVLQRLHRKSIIRLLDRLSKAFFCAVSPNAFKVVFVQLDEEMTEFRETNNILSEKLELKKGLPVEYRNPWLNEYNNYTLERSSI